VISKLFFDAKPPKQMFFIANIYQKNKRERKIRDEKYKATIYVRRDYIQISATEPMLFEKIVKKYT